MRQNIQYWNSRISNAFQYCIFWCILYISINPLRAGETVGNVCSVAATVSKIAMRHWYWVQIPSPGFWLLNDMTNAILLPLWYLLSSHFCYRLEFNGTIQKFSSYFTGNTLCLHTKEQLESKEIITVYCVTWKTYKLWATCRVFVMLMHVEPLGFKMVNGQRK
jgi:hypothetical protein